MNTAVLLTTFRNKPFQLFYFLNEKTWKKYLALKNKNNMFEFILTFESLKIFILLPHSFQEFKYSFFSNFAPSKDKRQFRIFESIKELSTPYKRK